MAVRNVLRRLAYGHAKKHKPFNDAEMILYLYCLIYDSSLYGFVSASYILPFEPHLTLATTKYSLSVSQSVELINLLFNDNIYKLKKLINSAKLHLPDTHIHLLTLKWVTIIQTYSKICKYFKTISIHVLHWFKKKKKNRIFHRSRIS